MNKLEFLFFQLFESLYLIDKNLYRSFRTPLDKDILNKKLSELKLMGTGLEWLYKIRNGNEDYLFNTPEFMPFGYMLSIEEAIRNFKEDDFFADCKMFPFISSLDGSFVSLNMKSKRNPNLLVYAPFIPMIQPESIYDNLELFAITIQKCYDVGAYKIIDRTLVVDYELETEISRKLNPNSEFWKRS